MDGSSRDKAEVIIGHDTFYFKVIPFGVMVRGATFLKMMNKILLIVAKVRDYVDDVVIFSKIRNNMRFIL